MKHNVIQQNVVNLHKLDEIIACIEFFFLKLSIYLSFCIAAKYSRFFGDLSSRISPVDK